MENHADKNSEHEVVNSVESAELLNDVRAGQELMHKFYQEGKTGTMAYKQLQSLLVAPDGSTWVMPHSIPEGLLEGTLESIKKQELFDQGQAEMTKIISSHDLSSPRYAQLYRLLTDNGVMKSPLHIDEKAVRAILDEPEGDVIEGEFTEVRTPEAGEKKGDVESFLDEQGIGMLDREMPIPRTPEARKEAIDALRLLDPSEPIKMYHGLNGGLGKALDVISSPVGGVEQRSGPSLALWPVMQFWKPGDTGLEYELKRSEVQFSGENNPDAVAEIKDDGVIYLINGHASLPMKEFGGKVLYTDVRGEDTDPGQDAWGNELPRWEGYRPLSREDELSAREISKKLGGESV